MPPSPRWRGSDSEANPSPSLVRPSLALARHAIPPAVKPRRWGPRGAVSRDQRGPPGSYSKSTDGVSVSRASLISTLPPSYHTRGSIQLQDAGAIPLYSPPISGPAVPPSESAFTDGYGQEALRSRDPPSGGLESESPTAQTVRANAIDETLDTGGGIPHEGVLLSGGE